MTFGYNTDAINSNDVSWKSISAHATNLIAAMNFVREETESSQRPLIFIGHSFGGLVIKSVLLHSALAEADERSLRAVKSKTLGIIFLGTPHQSDSLGVTLNAITSLNGKTELKESETRRLETELDQFKSISTSFMIFCCFETRKNTSTNSIVSRGFQVSRMAITQGADRSSIIGDHEMSESKYFRLSSAQ